MSQLELGFLSPLQRHLLEKRSAFADLFPHLHRFGNTRIQDFQSLSFFLGDKGDVMVLVKRFCDDEALEIMWSSGDDFVGALINLDRSLQNEDLWRPDKKKFVKEKNKGSS